MCLVMSVILANILFMSTLFRVKCCNKLELQDRERQARFVVKRTQGGLFAFLEERQQHHGSRIRGAHNKIQSVGERGHHVKNVNV